MTDEDGEETGEDVAVDDSWNYSDILWNCAQAEKIQRAFEKLTLHAAAEGAVRAVRIKQKSKTK